MFKLGRRVRGHFVSLIEIRVRLFRGISRHQGPVSRKSRSFSRHFRVSQFLLYLKNGEDLSRQTSQTYFFSQLENMLIGRLSKTSGWQMAFRARKVFGTFEKRAPGPSCSNDG